MISIKHLNVEYKNRILFKDASITIPANKLSMIIGKSGSGKTTLFYILGLISELRDYEYFLNGKKIDLNNQRYKSILRKTEIAFIFQDKNLHEYMSIKDNLKMYALLANKEYTDDKAKELLTKVQLDLPLDKICNTMSGGEKQRLAIACALIKEATFIIADEPTSALDHENRDIVIEILKNIAHEGKMVLVASHDEALHKHADVLYRIEDCDIKADVSEESVEYEYKEVKYRSNKFIQWYSKFHFGRKKLERMITFSIPCIIIFISSLLFGLQGGLQKDCEEKLNQYTQSEVYIYNKDGITKEDIDYLMLLDGVMECNYVSYEHIDTMNGIVIVVPYLDYQLEDYDYYKLYDDGNIYVSYDLKDEKEILMGEVVYKVKGVLKNGRSLIQGLTNSTVYIPYSDMELTKYDRVVCKVDSFNHLNNINERIKERLRNSEVTLSHIEYLNQKTFLDTFSSSIIRFSVIVVVLSSLLLVIMQYFVFDNEKYSFACLKANGLINKEFNHLLIYNTLKDSTKYIAVSYLLLAISILICYSIGIDFSMHISYIIVLVLVFIIELIPTLISMIYMTRVDPVKLLR